MNANETMQRILAAKQSASSLATEARQAREAELEGQSPELRRLWTTLGMSADLYFTSCPEGTHRKAVIQGVKESLEGSRQAFDLELAERNLQDAMDRLGALMRDEREAFRRRQALPLNEGEVRLRQVQRARQARIGAFVQAVREIARRADIQVTPHEVREVAGWLAG